MLQLKTAWLVLAQGTLAAPKLRQQRPLARLAASMLLVSLMAGCAALPSLAGRQPSSALTDTSNTVLAEALTSITAAHRGLSGVYPLADGRDAFAARIMMANAAERSLDVQYYIWHRDTTGVLLYNALRAAADRGVRVRLLLDDNNTSGSDDLLAILDAHPNIEVRLFNPFALRSPRVVGYVTDFFRLNRRMHNKSFTADNLATIVGGRNVGDEYFGAADEVLFSDLDMVAIGPVVNAVSNDFDRYWNSASAYPLALLVPAPPADGAARLEEEVARVTRDLAGLAYLKAMRDSPFITQLVQRRLPLEWGATRLVSDDPAKALGTADPDSRVQTKLLDLFGRPAHDIQLVSPYFVPEQSGADAFAELARKGVKVDILTNSLEATDVAAVHAGYAKWRPQLLRSGVSLYELRRAWPKGLDQAEAAMSSFGSSAASLHAKTFAVDGQRVFVGSFNIDPRSARLNTEMGLVVDSPALAKQLADTLQQRLPTHAYQVKLDQHGALYWLERDGPSTIRHDTEPGTTLWKRMAVRLMSVLPIDWLL